MRKRMTLWTIQLGPALAVGTFSGRFLSEIPLIPHPPNLIFPLLATLMSTIVAWLLIRPYSLRSTWPLLLLILYTLYPEPDPRTAVLILLLVVVTLLWGMRPSTVMSAWPLALALTSVFLLLYVATLAPGVLPADNGEFQLVATQLGVAHPPGFALYTLLAHLITRLPLAATPAYKVNLLSALTSTATLLLVFLAVHRLTRQLWSGITAAIALGTATTFWAQATTANIRSMTGLFAALTIYLLLRHRDAVSQRADTTLPNSNLAWLALAVVSGIVHHASLVFMAAVFLLFLLLIDRPLLRQHQRWRRPFLVGLFGLLPLLYFPLRATVDVRGASPGLATISGFLNHVLALGFRGDLFYFTQPAELGRRLLVMGNVLTFQFSPWLLAGMALGFALMLRRDRLLALLLGGAFIVHTLVTATYRAPQTVEYMLPAYIPLAIALGYGVGQLRHNLPRWSEKGQALVGATILMAALWQGWQHYPSYAILHQDNAAYDYAQNILASAPANSVILTDWHWATPLWYQQSIAGERPDVAIRFVFPESEPYAVTWANRIAAAYADGRSVVATHYDPDAYADLPIPEPIGDAFLFRQTPRTTLPADFQPLDLTLMPGIRLRGYHLAPAPVAIGEETVLTVAWEPAASGSEPTTLFAHLVEIDGRLVGQQNLTAQPQPEGLTLTRFYLTPRPGAAPGDFAVMVGTPGSDGRETITTLVVTAMAQPPATQNPVYRTVPGGRPLLRLVGFDWDQTLPGRSRLYLHWQTEQGYQTEARDDVTPESLTMPNWFGPWGVLRENWTVLERQYNRSSTNHYVPLGQGIVWTGKGLTEETTAVPGERVTLWSTFRSGRPVLSDLVISMRLVGYEADGFHWAWWDLEDGIPATGAIPTLKWIDGSVIHSPHPLTADPAATPGQTVGALLRVYDAFTNRPLPILDDRITNELQLPWIPTGATQIPLD